MIFSSLSYTQGGFFMDKRYFLVAWNHITDEKMCEDYFFFINEFIKKESVTTTQINRCLLQLETDNINITEKYLSYKLLEFYIDNPNNKSLLGKFKIYVIEIKEPLLPIFPTICEYQVCEN